MIIADKVARIAADLSILEPLPDPSISVREEIINGVSYLCVDEMIALPVLSISSEFDTSRDIQVSDQYGVHLGMLSFTKPLAFDIARLTSIQVVAYITEINLDLASVGSDYRFTNNYLVLDVLDTKNYLDKYYITAPLWGRFSHLLPLTAPYKHPTPQIKTFDVDLTKSTFASAILIQAINQYAPAERFLKFYHVLESDFDYIIVDKLRSVTVPTAPQFLGELLNSFGKTEYEKLVFILNERINDISSLVSALDLVLQHKAKAELIFYTFSKSSNPISNLAHFNLLASRNGFDQRNFYSLSTSLNLSQPTQFNAYRVIILKLTAYWIYRVRCCIAHNKIGEYMMQTSDEDFLVEFAEPLIREVLRQYLT